MKALLSTAPGGPETLELREIADPVPAAGEVIVAVKACGVNCPDALIIQDLYQFRPPRPFAPGAEIAGIVESVAPDVESIKPGERILAITGWGCMAEKVAVPAARCVRISDAMGFDLAAGFLVIYATSYHALADRAALKPGETLLVLGAAGGVGLAAVELGKAMGARVIAAVSSEAKAELAKAHGADAAMIYPAGPFDKEGAKALAEQFKGAAGKAGADVIYDPVGGDYSEAAIRAIAWQGRHLVVGFHAGIPKLTLNLTLLKGCQIMGVFWGDFARRDPKGHAANVMALLDLYARGAIKPAISERFPLARGGEAIAALAARTAMGKLVVTMG